VHQAGNRIVERVRTTSTTTRLQTACSRTRQLIERDRASMTTERARASSPVSGQDRTWEPIIGGGAGTGLSAKWEEAGGIDLIVIYNSGRYRMAGRGSLAGLLAYGNANEIVVEMAREVLPVVKHTPVLAGVNGTDPFYLPTSSCPTCGASGSQVCRTSRPSA
jgi:hypothetical protein